MKSLLVLVMFLALVLGAVEVASRITIEHQLEQRIDGYVPNAAAKVRIHGFPFLPKLIGSGRIDKISARAHQVGRGSFVFDRVDVTVTGLRINRSRLLHERKLEIVAIDTGTVTATMTQAELVRLVGVPVTLGNGSAQVTVAGVSVVARVSISNGRLHLDAPGLPLSVPIPTLPVLPCLAQVRIALGQLIGSCTFHEIPAALKIALQ